VITGVICPNCGSSAHVGLVGLPAGIYPAAFRCYACSTYGYNFSSESPEAERACSHARSASKAYAEEYRRALESKGES
jgi:hypothetical protein